MRGRLRVTLKTTENYATKEGDITAMGFTPVGGTPSPQGGLEPPAALLVKTGKQHGKATVSVAAKGYQGSFAAQVSPDPIGTWTSLPGSGKSRKLSGYATGTKLWGAVRCRRRAACRAHGARRCS